MQLAGSGLVKSVLQLLIDGNKYNKQIQRIYVPRHFMFVFEVWIYTFAEQKTETKLKNFIQSISISSGHDISTYRYFIKNSIKLYLHLHSKVLHIYRHW